MDFQLLPSSFDNNGCASARQHLTSFVIDDRVAVDAGSLGFAVNDIQRSRIRDVVLTHAHLDHIAGLPIFIDDLFSTLEEPVRIHAIKEVIDVLERDVFNWSIYPRFSELSNTHGPVIEYRVIKPGIDVRVAHLNFRPLKVSHKVPSTGFVISNDATAIALSGDTAEMDEFWQQINEIKNLAALMVECAFPNELEQLATASCHMSPTRLARELEKFDGGGCPVYVINLKPMYRERTIADIEALSIDRLHILNVGKIYTF